MWRPSLSVVMCTFNGAAYLEQQVHSIVAQTYPIAEFLIFDDGSTDETVAIAQRLAKDYPVIRIFINKVNLGYNKNFEQALKAAAGEVIAIADQDDYWLPEKLERMMEAWRTEMPIIHCDSQRFSGAIPRTDHLRPTLHRFSGTCSRRLFLYNSVNGHALLLHRRLLPMILPFSNDIYYDWWVAVVASANGGVDYLPKTLVLQRVHPENASIDGNASPQKKWIAYRQMVSAHLKKFVTAPNLSNADKALGEKIFSCIDTPQEPSSQRLLFGLLLRHRKDFFYQKKRAFALLPHLKYAWQWAFG